MKKVVIKTTSLTLLLTMVYQLVFPVAAFALTTGPSQPEVMAFEPVGTTEMVDLFSGDFVYNIPLMDIDGYPLNISYHSGVDLEQEASWVGLGWSLNPGEINRTVRGIPDDFNGDKIKRQLDIQPEKNFMGKAGIDVGIGELFGFDLKNAGINLGVNASVYMNANNYKGLSAGLRAGVNAGFGFPSAGNMGGGIGFSPSIGIGSQSGVDLDASMQFYLSETDKADKDASTSLSFSVGSGVNSRTGMKDRTYGYRISRDMVDTRNEKNQAIHSTSTGINASTTVPVGIQNYVPVITNATMMSSFYIQLKAGLEVYGLYPTFLTGISGSRMSYVNNGDRPAYGYMYLENAPDDKTGMLDFIRDKDGMYNRTMSYLPMASLAYDIYSVSGQGTGGVFRPYRNDIGTVYDPYLSKSSENANVAIEAGAAPNLFEIGADVTTFTNEVTAGPWVTSNYQGGKDGTLYEKLFFKQAGELTYNNQLGTVAAPNNAAFSGTSPLNITASYSGDVYSKSSNATINFGSGSFFGNTPNSYKYNNSENARTARANLISVYTADRASNPNINPEPKIMSYEGDPSNPSINQITRNSGPAGTNNKISAVSQVLPDGRRYIYGIPAMNNCTRDITFGTGDNGNTWGGDINIGATTPTASTQDPERYYNRTTTPGYAHSYLLTEVLSADYVDISGNGCTDDDLGGFVKLNYNRASSDYRWRAPAYDINNSSNKTAHYDPGFQSDPRDGKASVSMGSREQWYVSTIESKNLVAEFYTSPRADAKGMTEDIDGGAYSASASGINNSSYELDKIVLYDKVERYTKGSNAVPIKTVIFKYDYSLCPGTLNSDNQVAGNSSKGKLTLKNIYIKYGNSDKNLMTPYSFSYSSKNPSYSYGAKDRWGTYKDADPALNNFEFPYSSQKTYSGAQGDIDPATSYNLTGITLPSGAKITVEYESDDYAYVQNKRAMLMTKIVGVGPGTDYNPSGNQLYVDKSNQSDYIYFKRSDNLGSSPDTSALRKTYLEGENYLYYSVSTDVRGGAYEQIKGFGEIDYVGLCTNNNGTNDYAFVKLKKVNSNGINFSPMALYAMNYAKYYINQIFYPGYGSFDPIDVLKAFKKAAGEIKHMSRPLQTCVERGYCKNINIAKSWIRLQSPNLCKKGGGIRVKRLKINDQWQAMAGGTNAQQDGEYGRDYDYTIDDPVYGKISSGVASYEPLTGGDENPFRSPVPYTAAENMALPAMKFFQLMPLGENFYPAGTVGYSSVKVRSMHIDVGRSSMNEDENLFYTAKDFPIRVEYLPITPTSYDQHNIFVSKRLAEATQGYTLYLNDMHGKPKAVNSYVVRRYDNTGVQDRKLIKGVTYYYNKDNTGKLDNKVMALLKDNNGAYRITQTELGKESDLTFDSRQNYDNTESVGAEINANVMLWGIFPIPFPMVLPSYNASTTVFHSMVATKIVQQYGIVKRVESIDHEAKTAAENLVYDGETGNVLLTRINNEFNDNEYTQQLPAYYAYDRMGAAYNNIGFKEQPTRLYVNRVRDGYMESTNMGKYAAGDELLYQNGNVQDKLWVMDKKQVALNEYYGFSKSSNGYYAFFLTGAGLYNVTVKNTQTGTTYPVLTSNALFTDIWGLQFASGINLIELPPGSYTANISLSGCAQCNGSVISNGTTPIPLTNLLAGALDIYEISTTQLHTDNGGIVTTTTTLEVDSVGAAPKCMTKVLPRYTLSHPLNSSASNYWWSSGAPQMLNNFSTEVVRSGRRNMLNSFVQTANFTATPNYSEGTQLTDFLTRTGLISVNAGTFSDDAVKPYENDNAIAVPGSASDPDNNVYEGYNSFVTGLKGNFRPLASYAALANRLYNQGVFQNMHSRKDGVFSLSTLFWEISVSNPSCGEISYIQPAGLGAPQSWKMASTVTKYDMFGNGIEEVDAAGIYSSAQYDFNKKLPVAVASNARQESITYESFEDLNSILIPEQLRKMWHNVDVTGSTANGGTDLSASRPLSGYFSSPFHQMFYGFISGPYTVRGQNYYRSAYTSPVSANSAVTVMTGIAHTGSNSLRIASPWDMSLKVKSSYSDNVIGAFSLLGSKKYIIDFWANAGQNITVNASVKSGSTVIAVFNPKCPPIEGWQLMEATVDMSAVSGSPQNITLSFGNSMNVDDIRIMPSDANLKSFVYDYAHNNRLMAQLDENHYATFFEYDQEGQLVRVKKETEKGILTVSENRKGLKIQ